jgi:UDP-glucuronate 4-epimerase
LELEENKMKQKIILVTGCAGFIGSHVAENLLKRGDTVIGVDEVNDYYNLRQKEANLKILKEFDNFIFYKQDLADFEELKKVFDNHSPEYVAHLGARAGVRPSIENPFIYEHSNIKATLNLLELAKDFKIQNFVLTSSSSVYGNQKKIPFSETDSVDLPISPYAATKKSTELLGYTYHHLYGLNVNVIRPFTIYGPRGRPDMAPFIFVSKVSKGESIKKFGDGSTKRDYTFVLDFVKGFISALDTQLGYEIFNLGNNTPVDLNEFIETVEKVTGKKAIIEKIGMQPGDVEITYADISKAKKLLDYEPKTNIEEGLREFYNWYRELQKIL